jgi:predicted metal-dependent hydrolase
MKGKSIVRPGEVTLGNCRIRYRLYRVPRRKHVHLVIGNDGVLQVRAPYRFSQGAAAEVICGHRTWVLAALQRAQYLRARCPRIVDGARLPLLDEQLVLRIEDGWATSRRRVRREGDRLLVSTPPSRPSEVRQLLQGWYRVQARRHLPARLGQWGKTLGLAPARVTIRSQQTLWGSCSAAGNVSLNWRLMLLSNELADYVLVHELCHLRYLDHSQTFWDLVGSLIPDFDERRARLRKVQAPLPL